MKFIVYASNIEIYTDEIELSPDELPEGYRPGEDLEDFAEGVDSASARIAEDKFKNKLASALHGTGLRLRTKRAEFDVTRIL
jgi:hypothetical protein